MRPTGELLLGLPQWMNSWDRHTGGSLRAPCWPIDAPRFHRRSGEEACPCTSHSWGCTRTRRVPSPSPALRALGRFRAARGRAPPAAGPPRAFSTVFGDIFQKRLTAADVPPGWPALAEAERTPRGRGIATRILSLAVPRRVGTSFAPATWSKPLYTQRADGSANQPERWKSHLGRHAPHLAVLSFMQDEF